MLGEVGAVRSYGISRDSRGVRRRSFELAKGPFFRAYNS